MPTLFVLVRVCIWVIGFLQIIGSWASLSFAIQIVAKFAYCAFVFVCFDAIVEFYMLWTNKYFNDFLIGG